MGESPPKSPTKSPTRRPVTRYGQIPEYSIKFGSEERFAWQNAQNSSDVLYDIPPLQPSKSVVFGNSLRVGMDEENPDAKKRSTGPGSYEFASCYDHISEYRMKSGNRFAQAPRQNMAMKTPSPGAVYNIEKQYWNGPVKNDGIGFTNSNRQSLYGTSLSANADMFIPHNETGPAITIAKRFKPKMLGKTSPGAIYDLSRYNFKTGPAYSFGKGKGNRFKEIGFLPEIIND